MTSKSYATIFRSFWVDEDVVPWRPATRYFFLYLLSQPRASGLTGAGAVPPHVMRAETKLNTAQVQTAIQEIGDKVQWFGDSTYWVKGRAAYTCFCEDGHPSPKHAKGAAATLRQYPVALRQAFYARYAALKPYANPSDTLSPDIGHPNPSDTPTIHGDGNGDVNGDVNGDGKTPPTPPLASPDIRYAKVQARYEQKFGLVTDLEGWTLLSQHYEPDLLFHAVEKSEKRSLRYIRGICVGLVEEGWKAGTSQSDRQRRGPGMASEDQLTREAQSRRDYWDKEEAKLKAERETPGYKQPELRKPPWTKKEAQKAVDTVLAAHQAPVDPLSPEELEKRRKKLRQQAEELKEQTP